MSPIRSRGLLLLACFGAVAYAIAEDLTLTTYYPSPRGVYKSLRVVDNASLGTSESKGVLTIVGGSVGTEFGDCPAGYDWYDENQNGLKDAQGECKRTALVVSTSGPVGIGTVQPAATFGVKGGDIAIETQGAGLRMRAINDPTKCYNLYVDSTGALLTLAVTCVDPPGGRTLSAYRDSDYDGYTVGGAQNVSLETFEQGGWRASQQGNDCDDNDPSVWQSYTGWPDQDNDGWTLADPATVCAAGTHPAYLKTTSSASADCNDNDAAVHVLVTCYPDGDNDEYGDRNAAGGSPICASGPGVCGTNLAASNTDCNDSCSMCFPSSGNATSSPDGLDQDCNGTADDTTSQEWGVLNSSCGPVVTAPYRWLTGSACSVNPCPQGSSCRLFASDHVGSGSNVTCFGVQFYQNFASSAGNNVYYCVEEVYH
ncbi:MAG: hypothetical protein HYY15_02100 [Candidatus Omnitrophica bacterium]|nr:hypothetical protein [Candidatus Omnitrophota bacterium]